MIVVSLQILLNPYSLTYHAVNVVLPLLRNQPLGVLPIILRTPDSRKPVLRKQVINSISKSIFSYIQLSIIIFLVSNFACTQSSFLTEMFTETKIKQPIFADFKSNVYFASHDVFSHYLYIRPPWIIKWKINP